MKGVREGLRKIEGKGEGGIQRNRKGKGEKE